MISGISTRTRNVATRAAEVDFAIENLGGSARRADGRGVGVCVQDLMTPGVCVQDLMAAAATRRF